MRIINTKNKSDFLLALLTFNFLLFTLFGCAQSNNYSQAQDYVKQSQAYYQQAINIYKDLISRGKDLDQLHFELGQLYYSHGDFSQAIEEFRKTNETKTKKFLSISYYRMGNFTDALDTFSKNGAPDDEALYYYGLTSEKLNLFDQALGFYRKIKQKEFSSLALSRINLIEKQVSANRIKDISPQVHRIIQAAPVQSAYPQAGALILFCDEKIEITAQDTQISSLHYVVKILNERGKENFSESHIEYDSTFEKVELEYARTIKPDGSVVEVGTRHIRDVSKYLNFPLYSNVRAYIISFPEITEGASIEYRLKIYRNQLINKKDFVASYPLETSEPIISANFSINLPANKALHIKTLNDKYNNFAANLKPKIEQKNGRLIYLWQFKDIPQIIPEANMPPDVEINPAILISTFNSWQEIHQWWWKLAQDKIKADEAIKDKIKELVKGQDSAETKARAIYNFCAQKIRYVAVEYGQAGYEPHYAADIFKNKYGDCKDQAILLVTMLKEAGLEAFPVLISTKDYYDLHADFPAMLFNHCIAAVSLKDKTIFLDSTAQTCSFGDLPAGDQGRQVLVFKNDKYEIQNTPLYPAQHNLVKQDLKIRINKDETITAQKDIFVGGMYDQAQRYWLLYTPPQLIEEALKEKIQNISIGATLEQYEVKNLSNLNLPVILSYTFRGPEYFTNAGNLRVMPQLASVDVSLVAKDKRNYPIDFGILDSKENILEFEIPDNFSLKYLPDSVTEDSPWLKFSVEYFHRDNKIYFRQKEEFKKNNISEQDYSDFKAFFENLAKKTKQRVILEKIK